MIRIALIDDHPLLRDGLKARMSSEVDIEVVAEANNAETAIAVCEKSQPDIALLDINLPERTGISVIGSMIDVSPATRVIMLTMHDDPQYLRGALRAGAKGYVLKHVGGGEIVRAVHAVHAGGTYFSEAMSQHLLNEGDDEQSKKSLSEREIEVLTLLAQGLTNKQIAKQLALSPRTVETHRANVKQKLGAASFAEMLRFAVEQGLIDD
ncbi:MAG: response regulator transcription factor [Pseudomonadota bacterium]